MGPITLFTDDHCQQCVVVREHLALHGIPFNEINLTKHPERRRDMIQLTNNIRTPQIFFNDRHLTMHQLEEHWKRWKKHKHDWDESFRFQFTNEVQNLADPLDSRLALPSLPPPSSSSPPSLQDDDYNESNETATISNTTIQTERDGTALLPLYQLPDGSRWSAADLTRQLLYVTKFNQIKKRWINHGEKNQSSNKVIHVATVPCFLGRDVLQPWGDLFGAMGEDQKIELFQTLVQHGLVHHVSGSDIVSSFWTLHPFYQSHVETLVWNFHVSEYVVLNDFMDLALQQEQQADAMSFVLDLWHQMDHLWHEALHGKLHESKSYQRFEEAVCGLQTVSLTNEGLLNDYHKCIAFGLNLFHIMLRHALLLEAYHKTTKANESDGQHMFLPQIPVARPTSILELPRFLNSIRYKVGRDVISLLGLSNWLLYGSSASGLPRELALPPWLRWLVDRKRQIVSVKTDERIILAMSWGTVSSPKVIPYHPECLDEELNWSVRHFCERFVRLDETRGVIILPQHFLWYRRDFTDTHHRSIMEYVVKFLTMDQMKALENIHRAQHDVKKYRLWSWARRTIRVEFIGHNWSSTNPWLPTSNHDTTASFDDSSGTEESADIFPSSPEDDMQSHAVHTFISGLTTEDDLQSRAMFTSASTRSENTWGMSRSQMMKDYYDYSVGSGFDLDSQGNIRSMSKRSLCSVESEFQQVVHSGGIHLEGEGDAWLDRSCLSRCGSQSSRSLHSRVSSNSGLSLPSVSTLPTQGENEFLSI